jgi:hypothetical protein
MSKKMRDGSRRTAHNRSDAIVTEQSGFNRFRGELEAGVVDEIVAWDGHPELGRIYCGLQAVRDREQFLNIYSEAMVARYLLARDCRLRVEVTTPNGRACDFEVDTGDSRFYLHVKRLSTERPKHKQLSISSRLRYLERIERPYVVKVRFPDELPDDRMQRFVTEAAEFIKQARVGDEIVIRDDDDHELGGCQIVAPWQGTQVSLVVGVPQGFIDEAPRIRRLMRKAYHQFMPGATNVILVCSSDEADAEDFTNALLGSHIERWDEKPPEGKRVAHGRDSDGFWYGRRFPESAAAGWFHFMPDAAALQCRLLVRPDAGLDPAMEQTLVDLFNGRS